MQTVIKGGRVIDPGNLDDILDIVIKGGNIVEIKQDALTGNENKKSKIIRHSIRGKEYGKKSI